MNIFLAPRSNETSYKNFLSTIENGIDYSIVEPYLSEEGKRNLSGKGKLFAWGNKETKKTSWEEMEEGDLVLFYKGREGNEKEGKFLYAGTLLYKQHSKQLGLSLWPPKKGEQPWTCVFFLDNLRQVYIPIREIISLAGYKDNFVVYGFMPLQEKGTEALIAKYGSINNFLETFSKIPLEYKEYQENLYKSVNRTIEVESHPVKEAIINKEAAMNWKLKVPPKKIVIEPQDKAEESKFEKIGFKRKIKKGRLVLVKRLKKWEYFQDKVSCLLQSFKFEDIEWGHSCWLGSYQIDAVGGYEGTFLVFECKSAEQPKFKNIRSEITQFAGKKTKIESAIREKFGSKYNEVKFILAIEDIDISETDEKLARDNDIYIWGSNYLKIASELYSIIGPLAIHYLLKELDVASKIIKDEEGGAYYRVPAFRITIGGQQIYSFFLSAAKLLNLVYVFRLQPGNEEAYQRFINKRRIFGTKEEPGITDFINSGGFFKTNVVCSIESQVKFETKSPGGLLLQTSNIEFGILDIPKYYGSVWVIDGQHRIYGFANAKPEYRNMEMGVVAYQDIEKRQQARDFIDINQKQKPVDPNTLWDLLSQTDPFSLQGAITKVIKELSKRGIFKGKILIPGKAYHGRKSKYPLKLANLCNTLYDRRMLEYNGRDNLYKRSPEVIDSNRYPDSIIEYPADIIEQYFSLIWEAAEKTQEWRKGFVLRNNGFNIFIRVLAEILKFKKGNWNKQEVKSLIDSPLKAYFELHFAKIKDIRTMTSNEAGRAKVALELIKFINQKENSFAHDFIEEAEKRERVAFEKSEPYQILKELETKLRLFIEESLKNINKNWWKERVPGDVQESAKQLQEKNECPWPWIKKEEKSPIFYIDFPDYLKIIIRKDNWNEVFQKTFKDANAIAQRLRELQPIRNNIAHSRSITSQESTALRLYADQIIKTIEVTK